jgi:YihY family inner membrane protein
MLNQGLLLSGAIAYYTLLSIVPMSILTLIGLSHFVEEETLFQTLSTYVGMVMPGYAAILNQQVRVFLEHRHAVGIIGVLAMLFFSSMAFSVLENAMSVIFLHHTRGRRRHFLVSFIIPYLFIFSIALGIALISFATGTIEILQKRQLAIFGWTLSLEFAFDIVMHIMGLVSEVLMLASLYLFMPPVRIRFRYALIGGTFATILWEITRRGIIWYYSTLSMVNLIYGSFATVVVALLTAEAIALIVLLGAQVIAELGPEAI